jgi:hypothetical protein
MWAFALSTRPRHLATNSKRFTFFTQKSAYRYYQPKVNILKGIYCIYSLFSKRWWDIFKTFIRQGSIFRNSTDNGSILEGPVSKQRNPIFRISSKMFRSFGVYFLFSKLTTFLSTAILPFSIFAPKNKIYLKQRFTGNVKIPNSTYRLLWIGFQLYSD